jgi:cytoskeleton protein RodZ
VPQPRRASRDAALVELQRLHAAILASRASRGAGPAPAPAPGPDEDAPSPESLAAQALRRRLQDGPDAIVEPVPPSRRGWWLAVAAVVIAGAAWAGLTLTQRPEVVTEAAPPTPKAAPPRAAAPEPPAPARPVAPATRPIQVRLDTIRSVWLRVTVDGVRALERELPAGETLSFEGDRAIVVRSGDAGGVRASMNGVDRGPLGRDGWPLTVPFTLDPPAPAAPPR